MTASDNSKALQRVCDVVDTLLGPNGCPWDKEQTATSLCEYVLEEAHELVDAIRHKDGAAVKDEIGDVLFLLAFIARLYADKKEFTLAEALEHSADKMIGRHPHVFSNEKIGTKDDLIQTWQRVKQEEAQRAGKKDKSVFGGLASGLSPLIKAYRVHSKAASAGFTWDSDQDAEQQLEAEWLEWLDASAQADKEAQERELGDVLFTLVEIGRRKGIRAGEALDYAVQRFLTRFAKMEEMAGESGREFKNLDMEEKNELWEKAKGMEK